MYLITLRHSVSKLETVKEIAYLDSPHFTLAAAILRFLVRAASAHGASLREARSRALVSQPLARLFPLRIAHVHWKAFLNGQEQCRLVKEQEGAA